MRKDVDCARVSWIGAGWYSGRCQHDQTNVNWVACPALREGASMGELTGPYHPYHSLMGFATWWWG